MPPSCFGPATRLLSLAQLSIGFYVLFNVVQACSAYLFGSLSHRLGSIHLLASSYVSFALAAIGVAFADDQIVSLAVLFALGAFAVGGIEDMDQTPPLNYCRRTIEALAMEFSERLTAWVISCPALL